MASERQVAYIKSLASKRIVPESLDLSETYLYTLNNVDVDYILDLLKASPYANADKSQSEIPEVDKGRYFIVDPHDGIEKFVKVDKPEPPSRWAGYTFVNVQASDDYYPIKNKEHRNAILREIAKDPINAMNEYGIRLGVCGMCGRTLTHRDSRLRGMGPICAGKVIRPGDMEIINQLKGML